MQSESTHKHILVIRLSALGDVAMMVPVLTALIAKYPQLKITVLTRAFFKPLFMQLKNVSVLEAEVKGKHKGFSGLWKLYQEVKNQNIDAVADLHNVLRSTILKGYFKLGGFPFYQIDKGRKEKKALTTLKDKRFKPLKSTHQRYADVFLKMGFTFDIGSAVALKQELFSESNGIPFQKNSKKRIGIAPFAAHKGKMYPLHLMEAVITELQKAEDYQIYLFGGGKQEEEILEEIARRHSFCCNVAGKLKFSDELALISNLDLMVSMDSGNGHIAAMYGIPTVTLWGVTHPFAGFAPFGQDENTILLADREKFPLIPTSIYGNKVPVGYEEVMETILPHNVVAKIQEVLKKNRDI